MGDLDWISRNFSRKLVQKPSNWTSTSTPIMICWLGKQWHKRPCHHPSNRSWDFKNSDSHLSCHFRPLLSLLFMWKLKKGYSPWLWHMVFKKALHLWRDVLCLYWGQVPEVERSEKELQWLIMKNSEGIREDLNFPLWRLNWVIFYWNLKLRVLFISYEDEHFLSMWFNFSSGEMSVEDPLL